MADTPVGSATAMLGGDAGNPGATGAAAPSPSVTPAAPAVPSTAGQPAAWTKDWDAEDAGLVEKKGWRDPKDLFKSYRELEKLMGNDKLVLPKDGADPAAWDPVYNRLGRPETPDKYQFPEGVDANTVRELAPQLHKIGVTQAQADALAKMDLARAQAAELQMQAAWNDDQAKAMQKLESEWGADTPKNIEYNRRAMRALGLSVDEATVYMRGGSEKFLRMLNTLGKAIGEDNSGGIENETALGFGMTPNRAAFELQKLKQDPAFMARWGKGDRAAREQYNQLLKQTQGARNTVGGAIR